jgi:HEAT repeat protein
MSKAAHGWIIVSLLGLSAVVIVIAGWQLWPIWQRNKAVQNLITSLPRGFDTDDWNTYYNSIRLLRKYGGTDIAVDALVRVIQADESSELVNPPFPGSNRSTACFTLGRFGPVAAPAIPTLITALSDSNSETRLQAARALGWIGPEAQPALDALRTACEDTEFRTRVPRYAKDAILKIEERPECIDILIGDLNSQSFSDIALAAEALGNLGASAKPAVPKLIELLRHQNEKYEKGEVRRAAATALRKIAPDTAEQVIADAR